MQCSIPDDFINVQKPISLEDFVYEEFVNRIRAEDTKVDVELISDSENTSDAPQHQQ